MRLEESLWASRNIFIKRPRDPFYEARSHTSNQAFPTKTLDGVFARMLGSDQRGCASHGQPRARAKGQQLRAKGKGQARIAKGKRYEPRAKGKNPKGSILFTGKKLLVADDSIAIQKVIALTFTDEGMEVLAVGDGDQARARLEEIEPDIVLADAHMPGIDGYELCRIIRQSERLKEIPVILLVGSFEPFDEEWARQAGVSDIVTKPFQSIRDLVSRVGSLLGKQSEDAAGANQYSTLGLGRPDDPALETPVMDSSTESDLKVFVEAPSPDDESMQDSNINVLVEAAPIPEHEPAESAGASCATDVELQTADTRKLERIDDETDDATEPVRYAQDDTIEIEPVMETAASMDVTARLAEKPSWYEVDVEQPDSPPADMFGDSLLDLEFEGAAAQAIDEDVVLDLDFEVPPTAPEAWPESVVGSLSAPATANGSPNRLMTSGVAVAEAAPEEGSQFQVEPPPESPQWGVAPPPAKDVVPTETQAEPAAPSAATPADLSPETIDAIARRVVEQLTDRVVREIAWEVVPDMAELLIKQKLDEQK
jgi:CheY-like chemotaxis protein